MIKQSIALGLLSASLISPAHATHQQIPAEKSVAVGVPAPIARAVEHLGVKVIDGRSLPNVCGPGRIAAYTPVKNVIVMCINNINDARQYVEAYLHETVHMVQDCRTGLHNGSLRAGGYDYTVEIAKRLADHKLDTIRDLYEESDWDYEVEAFYFEDKPAAVADGIATFCF